jgi:hypothetical protein
MNHEAQKKTKCLTKTIDHIKVMQVYGDLFYALRLIINEVDSSFYWNTKKNKVLSNRWTRTTSG